MLGLNSNRWLTLQPRPGNLWLSGIACLACLAVLTVLIADLIAADDGKSKAPDKEGKPRVARVVNADNGMPKLTVTYDGEKQKQIEVLPSATVLLNGSEAGLEDIRPADIVRVETDEKG